MKRTSRACSVTDCEEDYISGIIKSRVEKGICETQCEKYSWCRGFRSNNDECLLMTEKQPDPIPINGWFATYFGHWTEPDQWKNGAASGFPCYEKVTTGVFHIHEITTKRRTSIQIYFTIYG